MQESTLGIEWVEIMLHPSSGDSCPFMVILDGLLAENGDALVWKRRGRECEEDENSMDFYLRDGKVGGTCVRFSRVWTTSSLQPD